MRLKNEVIVGLVVVLGLVVLAVGGYWMTGRQWGGELREVTATFQRVGLLGQGSQVKYRGVPVGRVEKIQLSERGDGVFVTMTVNPDVVFPQDAAVLLSAESFFGDWQAEIVSQNDYPELAWATSNRPGVFPGAALPDITELTAVAARIATDIETLSERVELAFTEETAIKIRETIENIGEVSEQLGGFVDQQTGTYRDVSQNVLQATANVRDATATAERVANEFGAAINQGDIQAVLANARASSESLRLFSEQLQVAGQGVPGLMARADTTLLGLNQTVAGLQPALQQVGPTMDEARAAIATLQRAATRIDEGQGTLGRLIEDPALYEETQRAVATLRRLLADIQQNPGKYIGQLKVF